MKKISTTQNKSVNSVQASDTRDFERCYMERKQIIIEGNRFNNIKEFYTEIDRILTKDLTWKTGHNLDAFNDLLRGGFGVHKYGEEIIIIWNDTDKSKKDLEYDATIKYYEEMLKRCHSTNQDRVNNLLKDSIDGKGDTLFEILIIEIIKDHEQIQLILT